MILCGNGPKSYKSSSVKFEIECEMKLVELGDEVLAYIEIGS